MWNGDYVNLRSCVCMNPIRVPRVKIANGQIYLVEAYETQSTKFYIGITIINIFLSFAN